MPSVIWLPYDPVCCTLSNLCVQGSNRIAFGANYYNLNPLVITCGSFRIHTLPSSYRGAIFQVSLGEVAVAA